MALLGPAAPLRLRGLGSQSAVITAYQDSTGGPMTKAIVARVRSLGLKLKVAAGWSAPVRASIDQAFLKTGRALYIGGWSTRLSLPASKWIGAWYVGPGLTRRQAAELDSRDFRQQPDWRERLMDLEGWTLMYTCSLRAQCHGDVLIRLFHQVAREQLGQPATDEYAGRAAAAQSRTWGQQRVSMASRFRKAPTRKMGMGPPLMVGHGERERERL